MGNKDSKQSEYSNNHIGTNLSSPTIQKNNFNRVNHSNSTSKNGVSIGGIHSSESKDVQREKAFQATKQIITQTKSLKPSRVKQINHLLTKYTSIEYENNNRLSLDRREYNRKLSVGSQQEKTHLSTPNGSKTYQTEYNNVHEPSISFQSPSRSRFGSDITPQTQNAAIKASSRHSISIESMDSKNGKKSSNRPIEDEKVTSTPKEKRESLTKRYSLGFLSRRSLSGQFSISFTHSSASSSKRNSNGSNSGGGGGGNRKSSKQSLLEVFIPPVEVQTSGSDKTGLSPRIGRAATSSDVHNVVSFDIHSRSNTSNSKTTASTLTSTSISTPILTTAPNSLSPNSMNSLDHNLSPNVNNNHSNHSNHSSSNSLSTLSHTPTKYSNVPTIDTNWANRPYSGSDPSPTNLSTRLNNIGMNRPNSNRPNYRVVAIEDTEHDKTYHILPESELYSGLSNSTSHRALATSSYSNSSHNSHNSHNGHGGHSSHSGSRVFFPPTPSTPTGGIRSSNGSFHGMIEDGSSITTDYNNRIRTNTNSSNGSNSHMKINRVRSTSGSNRVFDSFKVHGTASSDEDNFEEVDEEDGEYRDSPGTISTKSTALDTDVSRLSGSSTADVSPTNLSLPQTSIAQHNSIQNVSILNGKPIRVIEVKPSKDTIEYDRASSISNESGSIPSSRNNSISGSRTESKTGSRTGSRTGSKASSRKGVRTRGEEWICERCNVYFRTQEALVDHCQFSKIHQIALMEEKSRMSDPAIVGSTVQYNSPFEGE